MADIAARLGVSRIRMRGYIRAASAAGFEADVVSVPGPDYTEEAGAAAGRILLGRDELPTAVVTGHDQQAARLLQVLSRGRIALESRATRSRQGSWHEPDDRHVTL
jgi:DNA-binding LacI/PurR family transcriptional regulator